ncbi:MAG: 3-deoxy-D-manno-octulosonic acid kinase [Pseudomonadota bacterium]
MLYDRAVINQISDAHFTAAGWPHSEALGGTLGSGGRGNTLFVGNVPRQFVLRNYMRGGIVGKLIRDRYVFTREEQVRAFAEWRLLKKLVDFGLPVPRPAAARYVRHGPLYTADLITVRLPGVQPLSNVIREPQDAGFWRSVGAGIHGFHEHGVYHADMNAYNLQIAEDRRLWMLDFDKGELRTPGAWQQETLRRLHRSLRKIRGLDSSLHFVESDWRNLLEAYFDASKSAARSA